MKFIRESAAVVTSASTDDHLAAGKRDWLKREQAERAVGVSREVTRKSWAQPIRQFASVVSTGQNQGVDSRNAIHSERVLPAQLPRLLLT